MKNEQWIHWWNSEFIWPMHLHSHWPYMDFLALYTKVVASGVTNCHLPSVYHTCYEGCLCALVYYAKITFRMVRWYLMNWEGEQADFYWMIQKNPNYFGCFHLLPQFSYQKAPVNIATCAAIFFCQKSCQKIGHFRPQQFPNKSPQIPRGTDQGS